MKITNEKIAQFRKDLEAAMRKLHEERGWYVSEATIQTECYDASDDYIAYLIDTGANPEDWAYTILM